MARMEPSTFGLHAAVAGGALPEEWQVLLASQASTLAALLSRMQMAAATMRRATVAGAGQASQDGGGSRLRGALGERPRAGRLGRPEGNALTAAETLESLEP